MFGTHIAFFPSRFQRWKQWLSEPVDIRPLVFFRMLFGLLMAIHCFYALYSGAVFHKFIEPPFTFNYIGFDWLQPLPGNGMYYFYAGMGLAALLVMAGALYRLSSFCLALLWSLQYGMQKVDYNNHYYLILLIAWILFLSPANRLFSVDAWKRPSLCQNQCHRIWLWLFLFQTSVLFVFAAMNKLDGDWVSGRFLRIQFSRFGEEAWLGPLYHQNWFPIFIAYAGILFDLLIVPALFWKRTRMLALLLSLLFHAFNAYTFRIGIFPFLAFSLNVFFLDRSTLNKIKALPITEQKPESVMASWQYYLLVSYVLFQLLVPLRYMLYPGNVYWTDEGYRLSWKMMLRTKSGTVRFKIMNQQTGMVQYQDPRNELSPFQTMWLAGSPDMIWQYAQRIKHRAEKQTTGTVSVYVISSVSLNRYTPQALVDSTVDLGKVKWNYWEHQAWIRPFCEEIKKADCRKLRSYLDPMPWTEQLQQSAWLYFHGIGFQLLFQSPECNGCSR